LMLFSKRFENLAKDLNFEFVSVLTSTNRKNSDIFLT